MKNIILILTMLVTTLTLGQSPEFINYSSVIRGNNGQALPNKNVSIRFSIRGGSADGSIIYQESHTLTTGQFGGANIQIGNGNSEIGDFSDITWGGDDHYLQIELDDEGGSNYQDMGTIMFVSVPYALHANTVSNEDDPIFENSVANGITETDTVNWNKDVDSTNEIQQLTLESNLLKLSKGGGELDVSDYESKWQSGNGEILYDSSLNIAGNIITIDPHNKIGSIHSPFAKIKGTVGQVIFENDDAQKYSIQFTKGILDEPLIHQGFPSNLGQNVRFRWRAGGNNIMSLMGNGNLGIGNENPSERLSVNGTIESMSGGIKFPDGSIQTTASAGGLIAGSGIDITGGSISNSLPSLWSYNDSRISRNDSVTVGNFRYPYLANPYPTYFPAQFQVFGSMYFDKLLAIGDHNPNDHIATYETGYDNPLLYSRYFYGEYGDLVIQGQSKTYTGNIHFVTGSNVSGDDPPTQRIIIMDNGNVGVGDYVSNPPKSKLQIKEGDVYVETIGTGVIIKSPNGTCWRMTVDNSGQMVTTTITCPN